MDWGGNRIPTSKLVVMDDSADLEEEDEEKGEGGERGEGIRETDSRRPFVAPKAPSRQSALCRSRD